MKRLQTVLSDQMWSDMEEVCSKLDLTVNELVKRILEDVLYGPFVDRLSKVLPYKPDER